MTRDEAALVRLRLMAQRAFGAMVENRRGGSEEAKKDLDAIDWAIATIQSKIARPQSDPDTRLVPCWLCGGQLIWQSDYNPEDMGYDPDTLGIVAILMCSDCGAMVEYTLIEEEE